MNVATPWPLVALRDRGVVDAEARVVVLDRADGFAVEEDRAGRVAEGDQEGLVGLGQRVVASGTRNVRVTWPGVNVSVPLTAVKSLPAWAVRGEAA